MSCFVTVFEKGCILQFCQRTELVPGLKSKFLAFMAVKVCLNIFNQFLLKMQKSEWQAEHDSQWTGAGLQCSTELLITPDGMQNQNHATYKNMQIFLIFISYQFVRILLCHRICIWVKTFKVFSLAQCTQNPSHHSMLKMISHHCWCLVIFSIWR